MNMPMDYYVWGAMLEHYRIHIQHQHQAELKTIMSTIRNDLVHGFIDKASVSFLQQISIVCCCNWWAM